jgi:outer membrane protein
MPQGYLTGMPALLSRLFLAAALLLPLTITSAVLAQSKIAVVDTQRAIMETEEGLRAQATLKKLFESRQRELEQKQVQIQKERENLEKQRTVLSQEALSKRFEALQKEYGEVQATFMAYNTELQKKQNELTKPIFDRVMALVRRVATQEGFDIVLDRQAVPYVRGDLDLTDRVITLHNQGGAGGGEASQKPVAKDKEAPARKPAPQAP